MKLWQYISNWLDGWPWSHKAVVLIVFLAWMVCDAIRHAKGYP